MTKPTLLNDFCVEPEFEESQSTIREVSTISLFYDLIHTAYRRRGNSPGTAVLFTSLDRGAGVSYVTSSVATELGSRGDRVLLADANALDLLAGSQVPSSFCKRILPSRVFVLGPEQVHPEDLSVAPLPGSPLLVLRALQAEFSSVVVDAPALSISKIALTLAAAVHGVIFVARAGHTEARALREAQETFHSLGARVLGCVYNAQ